MDKKVAIIIQARISSTRFPNKIFAEIDDKPALFHVIDQCILSNVDKVILAIPKNQYSYFVDTQVHYTSNDKFLIWQGSENNVLKRYYDAMNDSDADIIVRITSDCFLINKSHINKSLIFFKKNSFDYINNSTVSRVLSEDVPDDYVSDTDTPDGFNVEVFSSESLIAAYQNAISKYDIEHVTPWIKRNKQCEVFNTGKIILKGKFSVDTPDDLEIVRALHTLIKSNRIELEI
jgi:spore coat polysaccharide biosynthesis protein SpsF (cytidylyltransferase family)